VLIRLFCAAYQARMLLSLLTHNLFSNVVCFSARCMVLPTACVMCSDMLFHLLICLFCVWTGLFCVLICLFCAAYQARMLLSPLTYTLFSNVVCLSARCVVLPTACLMCSDMLFCVLICLFCVWTGLFCALIRLFCAAYQARMLLSPLTHTLFTIVKIVCVKGILKRDVLTHTKETSQLTLRDKQLRQL